MRIAEFSNIVQMNSRTIHFYIQEGLIHPKQDINQYYCFDQKNIEECQLIKLLKDLGFSIARIKVMKENPGALNYFLFANVDCLKKEIEIKQQQIELNLSIINKIAPNAKLDILNTVEIQKETPLNAMSISQLYPINHAYIIACFLLIPYVNQIPTRYRKFLWEQIALALSNQVKQGCDYMLYIIHYIPIEVLHQTSQKLHDDYIQLNNAFDLEPFKQQLLILCEELINDEQFNKKWKLLYPILLNPLKRFYQYFFEQYYVEYCQSEAKWIQHMECVIHEIISDISNTDILQQLSQKMENSFVVEDRLFSDLFLLYHFKHSFYTLLDNQAIQNYLDGKKENSQM